MKFKEKKKKQYIDIYKIFLRTWMKENYKQGSNALPNECKLSFLPP